MIKKHMYMTSMQIDETTTNDIIKLGQIDKKQCGFMNGSMMIRTCEQKKSKVTKENVRKKQIITI